MGTISKVLVKYREQLKSGHEQQQPERPTRPEGEAAREKGRSGSDRAVPFGDVTEVVRPAPTPSADRRETARHQPRLETRQAEKVLPAKADAQLNARSWPVPEALPREEPPQALSESAATESLAVEDRTGVLPPPFEKFDAKLVVLTRPNSFEAEQFKLLRSSLLFPGTGKAPRSILVTSTDTGEGKTLVSANLAASIALNLDRHVLLVDCDLRRPFLHKLLGVDEHPGLSEYLSGCCSLESLLLKTPLDRFSFLPAGKSPFNPAELLNSDKMFKLMDEVRDRYPDRIVIIDSPPPMLASESNALARVVDGVLLVIKYRSTKRADAAELVEKIGKDKILGTVMNFTDKLALGYYRSKKYGYKHYTQA